MSIFKCKMCGGTLEISENQTTAVCEYCGTQQTLPKLDDDKRANMYDRANHFRRNNEFDKAMSIYENILNEDNSDAEAYWSLVLCRYGIEYVEDPASHKRVPTVNRAQFTSIFDDDNYKSALQYADGYQKSIYEAEANAINEIQKGILAISQNEQPFDVFICYKETDSNGRRTQDSVLANDLYHQLVQEGFKVFFARITLEDKLGTAYEPYIFAALNSAKVMVVLGTKPEFFNAVWVKNEWSRYLALVKESNGKKVLIPAYKDMDPYDLPEEFSHLQAQDMSKLGFMQDLIRGIKKLATSEAPKQVVKETVAVSENSNIAPLLKRAFMYLEDREWNSANEYCEKVLDQDPENAKAYLGKLMVELNCSKIEDLKNCSQPFDAYNNYQKAIRFANNELKTKLEGYIEFINTRNENARLAGIYNEASRKMNTASTEGEFKAVAELFKSISEFSDSESMVEKCLDKAEDARKDAILSIAKQKMKQDFVSSCEEAVRLFESVSGWKDADEQAVACRRKIEELKAKAEADRLELERLAELNRIARKKTIKKAKRIAAVATPLTVVFIIFLIILNSVIIPNRKYKKAVDLMNCGKYQEAIAAFDAMEGYKDSKTQIVNCENAIKDIKYKDAVKLMNEGKYQDAIIAFYALGEYKDSKTQIVNCENAIKDIKYNGAVELMNEGKIVEAYEAMLALDGYKDSAEKAKLIFGKYFAEKYNNVKVGESIIFGSYEQDNNAENGKEEIEWLVLAKENNRILVISKNALDCKQYNSSYTGVTWETCTLRKWLNNEFINNAFIDAEKAKIPTVTVTADANPSYSTNPGNSVQDKVFLLSIAEANKYFSSDNARQCKPTAYAKAQGAWTNSDNENCWWWVRSPGDHQVTAAYVYYDGGVYGSGGSVGNDSDAVRPALWIDLNS